MRKILLALCLLCAPGFASAQVLVAHAVAAGPNSATTSAINTTGANLLVATLSWYSAGGGTTVTDSKGNTWTALTKYTGTSDSTQIFYCTPTSVGTGHTFTSNAAPGTYSVITVEAWGGMAASSPFQTGTNSGAAALQPGSVTPSNRTLLISSLASNSSSPSTCSGFTVLDQILQAGGNNIAGASGWLVQTSGSATNPTWTGSGDIASSIAAFKVAPYRTPPTVNR